MSNSQLEILEQYIQLSNQNGAMHVYQAARRMGLFKALEERSGTVESLAAACQTPLPAMQLLLNALCELGVIQRFADDYILAQVMRLLTSVDKDLGDESWQALEAYLRSDQCSEQENPTPYRARRNAIEWLDTPAAMMLIQLLEIGTTRQGLRILDLGAGSAVWSLAIAHQDPQSEVTAVDWPSPLKTAQQAATSIGVDSRFTSLEGDYWQVPLPAGSFDLVILANEILLYDDQQSQQLLQRAARTLKDDGEIAILETICCHASANLTFALRELDLALHWPSGRLRTAEQLEQVVSAAGLRKVQYTPLVAPPHLTGLMLVTHDETGNDQGNLETGWSG